MGAVGACTMCLRQMILERVDDTCQWSAPTTYVRTVSSLQTGGLSACTCDMVVGHFGAAQRRSLHCGLPTIPQVVHMCFRVEQWIRRVHLHGENGKWLLVLIACNSKQVQKKKKKKNGRAHV
eukprot:TRINITY_DN37318_c0_g1_i4.p2 TRINITY_DN37318_c0_g1~~TRINITY_DN37318_c0_g1_i4.p2  ORF type:complete len:122 (-),score=4.36 TRINITY_DN37318_c0_g1_i4:55-420(-)